ncbi:extracellular solute-binding protein family 1 [Beutenbergia cavernae DSM 12333]|uniref:Extracellular solute-binding protein family 1 n=1 Tax=Beutenbergia cavernae (strain ATCC BAA-8 / DSM 12333 / CCUG 43141 / JCM 11478 / NBRC 16432 / NCIMB 13614 / HKI 0122) TaxID=471853 RepID=C5BVC7_BEUC1|nr:ABC transporter substrate-binding protein [Beutenbergia cavernae]ACQ80514.1 extracellular solute-binding protein family 1 [Beutenbergia cavernae DSM 12333]
MVKRTGPPTLDRRTLLRAGLAGGAGLGIGALGACAAPGSTTAAELAFWHLMGGGDGIRMDEILHEMAGELSGARIKQTVLAWGTPYYTKLAMASAGGRAPDLAVVHLSRLAGYAPGGLLDEWDIARFEPYGVSEETFAAPIFERMQVDGKLFAISLDSHAFVRFFNPDVADAAGLLDADGTIPAASDVEEFVDQARAMADVTGDLGICYGWLGDSAHMWRLFWTFYTQQGATMEMADGVFQFSEDAFVGALDTIIAIISSDAANRRSDGGFAFSTFTSGGAGEFLSGVWDVPGLLDSGVPLDASPIPNLFGTGLDAVWGDSHAFVLPHQDRPDEDRREKVYEAVSLILKHSLTWATAGHTPAYTPITLEPEFGGLMPNTHYAETAEYLHFDPAVSFAGSGSNWQAQFGQAVQAALLGTASTSDALTSFTEMTDDFVRQAVI